MSSKANILVVDDEVGTRHTLQQILTDVGYEVQTVASGYEAIEMIKRGGFDAIIADIKMPGVDGLRVLEVAKGIDPEIEVIMITAYASLDSSIEALRNGAANYILKPINVEELKAALRNAVGRRRLARENKRLIESLKKSKQESERWAYAVGVLYKLSEDMRRHHDFKEIASIALDYLNRVVDFHIGSILLLTRDGGKMMVKVNPPAGKTHIEKLTANLLEEINQLTGRTIRYEDIVVETIKTAGGKEEIREIQTSILLPLTFHDVLIGGISVASLEKEEFSEVDQKTIYAVAAHAALAIEGHKI